MVRMITLLLVVCLLSGCAETKQAITVEVSKDVWLRPAPQQKDAEIRVTYKLELVR